MKKILLLILLFSFSSFPSIAQISHGFDSLRKVLSLEKEDTNKVNTLNNLGDRFWKAGKYDSALLYTNRGLILAKKAGFEKGINDAYMTMGYCYIYQDNYTDAINKFQDALTLNQKSGNKKGIANSLGNIGKVYYFKGNFAQALNYELQSLTIFEEIQDKIGIAQSYGNMGNVYADEGNYPKATDYYLKALTYSQQAGDKHISANELGNLGGIYKEQNNLEKALECDQKALNLFKEIGDKNGSAIAIGNIGNVYYSQGNYSKALENDTTALNLFQELGAKGGVARNLSNIANIYADLQNYAKALEYEFKSLESNRKIGNNNGTTLSLCGLGIIYLKENKYEEAEHYLDSSLIASKTSGIKYITANAYANLAQLDSGKGDYKKAWQDYKNYIIYKDSMVNEATIKKTTQEEMNYEFGRETDSTKAAQDKLNVIAEHKSQQQTVISISLLAGLLLVIIFSGFIVRSLKIVQKQKLVIEKEKERSEELLLNILPEEVADELKQKGNSEAKTFDNVTVMFTDFKNFTLISEKLTAKELVAEIDYCYKGFDNIIHKHNVEKIKTIGDSYMAVGGLPVSNETHAKDVINAAIEILDFMEAHKEERIKAGKEGIEIRIGINTGPVVAGIVGLKKFAYDIWGDTVNLASRMEGGGEAGKINISGSTYELVKNDFNCTYRGKIQAKNKGEVDMYFVS